MTAVSDELNKLRLIAFSSNTEADKRRYFEALSYAFQNEQLVEPTAALSLPVSNTDIDRTSEPKGHWQDGGKVWVEDHVCCLPESNTGENAELVRQLRQPSIQRHRHTGGLVKKGPDALRLEAADALAAADARIAELENERDTSAREFVKAHDVMRQKIVDAGNALTTAPAKAGEWQPIETAPRDGSQILLGMRGFVCEGRWSERFSPIHYPTEEAGWYVCKLDRRLEGFTHWQPLPEAPL